MLVVQAVVGYVVELGPEVSHGQWSADQAKCSSTWRELRAVDHICDLSHKKDTIFRKDKF